MDTPSLYFLIIFAIPLFILLFWIIKKDPSNKKWGYVVLAVVIIVGLYVAFNKAPSYHELYPNSK